MLKIAINENGELVLAGRFYASQLKKVKPFFSAIKTSTVIDCRELEFISSVGLELLLFTQKRLNESGQRLKLINRNTFIRDVFHHAGFDAVFDREGKAPAP